MSGNNPSEYTNSELHDAMSRWVQAALELLRSRPLIVAPDYDVDLGDEGHSITFVPARENLQLTVDANLGDLISQESYQAMGRLVFSTHSLAAGIRPIDNLPSQPSDLDIAELRRLCRTFLHQYLNNHAQLSFEEEPFEQVFAQLEDYIFQPGPFLTEWNLHLTTVSLEAERIAFSNGLALRQTTDSEQIWLLKQQLLQRMSFYSNDVRTVTVYQDTIDKWASSLQIPGPALTAAQTVVQALLLLTDQPIGLTGYHWQPVAQPFVTFPRHFSPLNFNEPPMSYLGARYVLGHDDAGQLEVLWEKCQRARSDNRLAIALTRLADSNHRSKDEDRLLDYWIALESLILQTLRDRGRVPGQQGNVVAAAVAHYIGTTADERDTIAGDILESHTLRNHITHAHAVAQPGTVNDTLVKTGTYLRAVLRKRILELD